MKRGLLLILPILLLAIAAGCGNKRVSLHSGVAGDIAVLTLDGDLPDQTADQVRELDIVLRWMDRDIIKGLTGAGFKPVLIKERKDYSANMGKLLIVEVTGFNAGNRAARAFVGYGAGAASLDLSYELHDERGGSLMEWSDGVGSSKGGTYCAQTLNQRAVEKLAAFFNN